MRCATNSNPKQWNGLVNALLCTISLQNVKKFDPILTNFAFTELNPPKKKKLCWSKTNVAQLTVSGAKLKPTQSQKTHSIVFFGHFHRINLKCVNFFRFQLKNDAPSLFIFTLHHFHFIFHPSISLVLLLSLLHYMAFLMDGRVHSRHLMKCAKKVHYSLVTD